MAPPSRQRLTVWAGATKVAMAASNVAEVIREPRITRMPHGPSSLLGVAHLRGRVMPVVSLCGLLGGDNGSAERVVVLRRDPPLGLAVKAVEALRAIDDDTVLEDGRLLLDDTDGARWIDLDAALAAQFAAFRAEKRSLVAKVEGRGEQAVAETGRTLAFLKFMLADQVYALPLDAVSEVASVPAEIAALPRTEDVLRGVVQRRGEVLPLLSTRALLGLPESDGAERLIVVRVGGHALGLIVDQVDAVLRIAEDRLAAAPSLFNRGAGEARIEAVLRLPDGKGVVSVLAPEKVLADARVERLLASGEMKKDVSVADPVSEARRERFLIIELGEERYGLPVAAIDEVIRRPDVLTRLPKAPAYVEGVVSLRGRIVPIIDQRQRFAVAGEAAKAGRIVVVTLGALQAGFAVDGVAGILETSQDELLPAPEMADGGGQVFDRAIEHDGEVILLIDPKALLDRAEADLLRDLAAGSSAS